MIVGEKKRVSLYIDTDILEKIDNSTKNPNPDHEMNF